MHEEGEAGNYVFNPICVAGNQNLTIEEQQGVIRFHAAPGFHETPRCSSVIEILQ